MSISGIRKMTLLVLLAGVCVVYRLLFFDVIPIEEGLLKMIFLDVGQGDATLIESPTGVQVLVDGGPDSSVLRGLSTAMGFFDKDIDMIVATHPDKDHIAGLIDVLDRYDVHAVLMTENESDTPVANMFKEQVEKEEAMVFYARSGQQYDIGGGVLTVLFPDRDPTNLGSNTSSIVLRLSYGETDVVMTGDSPQAIEKYLVSLYGTSLQSEILKVGHHGSKTSSSEVFVKTISPEYAIISAGKDNSYGHPHKEVTDLLLRLGIEAKNTADIGSITFTSDGVHLVAR